MVLGPMARLLLVACSNTGCIFMFSLNMHMVCVWCPVSVKTAQGCTAALCWVSAASKGLAWAGEISHPALKLGFLFVGSWAGVL